MQDSAQSALATSTILPLDGAYDLGRAMADTAENIEQVLNSLLPELRPGEPPVVAAMRYATLAGGKRLRPFLVVSSARVFGVTGPGVLRTAAALEMVHCYSLIHDDLPAMDNDDLRRGRPTTHKAFDEATAILAGNALLTLALEILGNAVTHPESDVRISLVTGLARAAGVAGMIGGQAMDMAVHETPVMDLDGLIRLQQLKTGALFAFAGEAGAILGKAADDARRALISYAYDMGVAFQIADDLLDVRGEAKDIGKTPGKDAASGKVTFVSLLGEGEAEVRAHEFSDRAIRHLDAFGPEADALRAVARFAVERRK
ncbi:polyprenyl synthetase family protein [Bordetella muralis]